jgi:hypothetical protein
MTSESQKAEWFVESCDEMLDNPKYQWAYDTIEGIRDNILKNGRVTEKQQSAIRNIRTSIK